MTRPTAQNVSHTTGGIIPKAKIKTIKMTFVIILGEAIKINFVNFLFQSQTKIGPVGRVENLCVVFFKAFN